MGSIFYTFEYLPQALFVIRAQALKAHIIQVSYISIFLIITASRNLYIAFISMVNPPTFQDNSPQLDQKRIVEFVFWRVFLFLQRQDLGWDRIRDPSDGMGDRMRCDGAVWSVGQMSAQGAPGQGDQKISCAGHLLATIHHIKTVM